MQDPREEYLRDWIRFSDQMDYVFDNMLRYGRFITEVDLDGTITGFGMDQVIVDIPEPEPVPSVDIADLLPASHLGEVSLTLPGSREWLQTHSPAHIPSGIFPTEETNHE